MAIAIITYSLRFNMLVHANQMSTLLLDSIIDPLLLFGCRIREIDDHLVAKDVVDLLKGEPCCLLTQC
jgi:hypothetical protein